ncbi:DUF89 domain protein [Xylona heveae TC161]|uniref:Sugar phosphate phosphatase n=1 Tax=Xylona heveae (strain CBS 132557 / TC161) TaxID=1328760 RepID=A0A165GT63_XYLHT|nr:DUF89 domain protein [Xylona heveae TC161]KZF22566.1 DUF89 domain protein [Xylona heveae TC161]
MEFDTKTPPYYTSDQSTFAYVSARDRWPVILTGAIDDVHRATLASKDAEHTKEGKAIIEGLAKLKYEIQHDRQLTPLPEDGQPDIADYNKELEQLGEAKWFNVPWLFSECYLYRRLSTFFTLSKHWKTHDVFARQKISTFKSSRPAVLELAAQYKELDTQLRQGGGKLGNKSAEETEEAEKLMFTEMCDICLWGNATDLSLLTSLTYEDIQKLQGSEARKSSQKNIISNDLPAAYEVLSKARKANPNGERRVDFILDNAGFELYVDLILAGYLLSANLATSIVMHPKNYPWFVSDVIPADFGGLLNALANAQSFYSSLSEDEEHQGKKQPQPLSEKEESNLSFLFQKLSEFHAEGKLSIRPNRFWTEGGSFWRLPGTAPELFKDLQGSELVIAKGDLNYRKLTGDAQWPTTTPFTEAIGPLGPGSGMRTLALRTCKADVVVGLPPGEDDRLRALEGGGGNEARKWAWSGKWAVVQFCDGKASA